MMTPRGSCYKSIVYMFLFGIACVSLLMLTNSADADSKITIKPVISASAEFDSNFWRTEEEEREVYTFTVRPGAELGFETKKTRLYASYTLEGFLYEDKDDVPEGEREASDQNFWGHLFVFNGDYDVTNRFTIGLSDDFTISQVPTELDSLGPAVDREQYTANLFEPWIQYRIGDKWRARLSALIRNFGDVFFECYAAFLYSMFAILFTLSRIS